MANQNPFEQAMRERGYSNFRKERGRYCHQILNELQAVYLAGWRDGFMAENSMTQEARREVEHA